MLSQLIINIVYISSIIFLVGISFSLIFSTARFFHFAHAVVITSGAYGCYAFSELLGLSMPLSVALAILVATGLGWSLEFFVYRAMRRNGASPLTSLLASLGLYIMLQNVISIFFGDDTKVIADSAITPSFSILGAKITAIQLTMIGLAVATFCAKVFFIDRTKIGLALRAVSDSPELAKVSGIDFDITMGVAFCLGSFIGSVVGLARAFDVGMTPTMGLAMLLLGVVAVVIGGNGKTFGVAIASVLLASLQQLAGWQFGTLWEETTAFLLLLFYLLCRPQGLFGRISKQLSV